MSRSTTIGQLPTAVVALLVALALAVAATLLAGFGIASSDSAGASADLAGATSHKGATWH